MITPTGGTLPPLITVMIAANHPIMRDGLRLRVQREPDMRVVCEVSDPSHTLRNIALCSPDVVLIDLQLPHGACREVMDGIRKLSPSTPMVVLAYYPEEIDRSCRPGQGQIRVLSNTAASETVIAAIRDVARR